MEPISGLMMEVPVTRLEAFKILEWRRGEVKLTTYRSNYIGWVGGQEVTLFLFSKKKMEEEKRRNTTNAQQTAKIM
jgi:hypothetical protein